MARHEAHLKDALVLVDDPVAQMLETAYEAAPNRLVLLHRGSVVFASGQGPFQYDASALPAAFERLADQRPQGATSRALPQDLDSLMWQVDGDACAPWRAPWRLLVVYGRSTTQR